MRDGLCCDLVVISDHDHTDVSHSAVLNGRLALGPGWVDETDHADKCEADLHLHEVGWIGELRMAFVRSPIVIVEAELL